MCHILDIKHGNEPPPRRKHGFILDVEDFNHVTSEECHLANAVHTFYFVVKNTGFHRNIVIPYRVYANEYHFQTNATSTKSAWHNVSVRDLRNTADVASHLTYKIPCRPP